MDEKTQIRENVYKEEYTKKMIYIWRNLYMKEDIYKEIIISQSRDLPIMGYMQSSFVIFDL